MDSNAPHLDLDESSYSLDSSSSPATPSFKMPAYNNSSLFNPSDFLSMNHVGIQNLNSSMPCTTPIIGQKRMSRKGTTSSSFNSHKQQNNSPSNNNSNNQSSENGTDSLLLTSSMSTLNKNMTLNSPNSPSTTTTSSPSTCKVNVPKSPKPQRTLAIFDCVIIGLK